MTFAHKKNMAAPLNNKFWELRSKHGRDKVFQSPQTLWESACEYFQWCEDNPWQEQDWVGKDGDEVTKNRVRPFTLSGLCILLECSEQTFRNYSQKAEYKDFFEVCTRVEQIIRTQKFEGAATGFFNANIIARDLGLTDKQETKTEHSGDIKVTLNIS